jgi:hypothetical protein
MRRVSLNLFSMALRSALALAVLVGANAAMAQSGDLRAQDQSKPAANATPPAESPRDSQRKVDEFTEAAQAINGPAGNPECVWLGRRVIGLMWRDDMDTAFRHLDLYDRFGCPGGHIQAAFRCLTRFGPLDPKAPESLTNRVHVCWVNPAAQPPAPVAATAPAASGTTPPQPAPTPAPAAAPATAPKN